MNEEIQNPTDDNDNDITNDNDIIEDNDNDITNEDDNDNDITDDNDNDITEYDPEYPEYDPEFPEYDPQPKSNKRCLDEGNNDYRNKKIKVGEKSVDDKSEQEKQPFNTKDMVKSAMKRCDVRIKKEDLSRYWTNENKSYDDRNIVKPAIIKFSKSGHPNQSQKLYSDDFAEECKTQCSICNRILRLSSLESHVKNKHELDIEKYTERHGDPEIVMTGVIEKNEICPSVRIYHICKICRKEMVMTKPIVEDHVQGQHSLSLSLYIDDYMKVKENTVSESKKELKNEDANSCKTKSLRKRITNIKYCDDESSSDEEDDNKSSDTEDQQFSEDKKKNLLSVIKNMSENSQQNSSKVSKDNQTKKFSNNYENCCKIECQICYQVLFVNYLRGHTQSKHQMDITSYKKQFGSDYTYIVKTFHKCNICGSEMLFDQDTIASHVRKKHDTSFKDYNTKYMEVNYKQKLKKEDPNIKTSSKLKKKREYDGHKNKADEMVARTENKTDPSISKSTKSKLVENDFQWFNGNTFSCKVCNFKSTSLDNFKWHVKTDHNTTLQKFLNNYLRTMVKYECKICCEQIDHEKGAIKDHVESHFLSLEKYGTFYEKRLIETKEKEKQIEKEKAKVKKNIESKRTTSEVIVNASLPSLDEDIKEVEGPGDKNAKLTKQILEAEDSQSTAIKTPAKISIQRSSADSLGTIGSGSENEDVYVYLCPFPDCEFTTDFQVIHLFFTKVQLLTF